MSASTFLSWFLPPRFRPGVMEGERRLRIPVAVLLFLLVVDGMVGLSRVAMGHDAPLVLPFAGVLVGCLIGVRWTGKVGFVGPVVSGLLVVTFTALTLLAGTTLSVAFLGFAFVSMVAMLLNGRRASVLWMLVSLVAMGWLRGVEAGWWPGPAMAPSGRATPLVMSAAMVLGAFGIAWAYEGVRRRDRRVLSVQAQRTSALLNALPEVVLEIDETGVCVGRHGLRASRQPFCAALGQPLAHLFRADARSLEEALDRVRVEQATLELELDREDRTWNLRITPFRDRDALVVARDVTTPRQLEAQLLEAQMRSSLERADRMSSIGVLAAGMAHEINNPLAYLVGNLAVLEGDRLAPLERAGALADARDAADRIRRIVDDLRVYARDQEAPEDEAVPLPGVLSSALKLARNQLLHRARVVVQNEGEPVAIGSEARLVQVVLNLLVNAAQAIPPGAASKHRVTLRSWVENGRAKIAVEDTGEGIPPDVLEKVTEPFFTTKPVGVGTGLGLSVCDGIVRQIGGVLAIESQLGRGTKVVIDLPAAAHVERTPRQSERVRKRTPPPAARILVIDDEPLVRRALRRLLRAHEVVEAESGREALTLLAEDRAFDLVLCDVMMPDGTGMELYEELRCRIPELAEHFVFMTGGAFDADLAALSGRGPSVRRVIQKPFRPDVLSSVIAEELVDRACSDGHEDLSRVVSL